jgi:hypothetical protein
MAKELQIRQKGLGLRIELGWGGGGVSMVVVSLITCPSRGAVWEERGSVEGEAADGIDA